MKSLVLSLLAASAMALPLASFAQDTSQPLTRSQVRSELVQAEQQGTVPSSKSNYPQGANWAQQRNHANTAYGPSTDGSSRSGNYSGGQPDSVLPLGPHQNLFSHH
jgi:Ni/Co efflux regulator RcnB